MFQRWLAAGFLLAGVIAIAVPALPTPAILGWLLISVSCLFWLFATDTAQREARDRLAIIAERTSNAVVITDVQRRITWVNQGFQRITGYTQDEVLGKSPGELLQCDKTDPETVQRIRSALRKAEPFRGEILNRGKHGREYWLDLDIQPRFTARGEVVGFMAIQSDITQSKLATEALASRERELQQANRELQAANAKATQMADQAAAANRAKSDFLANMSHEIRTPMTAILGYAELLQCDHLDAAQRNSYADTIRRNGEHLLSVINDILDLSKIEAGKMTVERIETCPLEILRDVESLMAVRAEAKGIRLEIVAEMPLPSRIESDPLRLKQILVNLVGNAIKFTDQGSVAIRMTFLPGIVDEPVLQFDVVDTGIGLTPQQIDRLFEAFSQADSSTTRRFGGSGLGLKISKSFANLLGGDISVVSEPGVGSTFSLRIAAPCGKAVTKGSTSAGPSEQSDSAAVPPPGSPTDEPSLEGRRIYFAEDGPDNQRLIKFMLERVGARVEIFENGRRLLEALTEGGELSGNLRDPLPCDLILTDIQMPEMDGYTLAATLRAKGCHVPIVALTAYAMERDAEKCLAAGCDHYVSKPINRHQLITACAMDRRSPSVISS